MNTNPIGWFEIYVDDITRAKTFYENVFQVNFEKLVDPIDSGVEMYAFPSDMEQYGSTGALAKMEGVSPGGNSTLIYFACEDCAVEESRVEDAGGKVHQPKMSIGDYGFISMIIDTEGNIIGLHSMK